VLINGHWITSSQSATVPDRFDDSLAGSYHLADDAQVETAVAGSFAAFQQTRRLSAHERSQLLQRIARGIEIRSADFVDLIIREAGKPIDLAQAEVLRASQTFAFAAQEALRDTGEILAIDASPAGKNHTGLTRRFPIGLIFGITPFNFPLNLVAHKVAPALATGNTILIKPALKTPLTALLLGEVLVDAGILPGQVNILPFHHDLIPPLETDPRIAMISFTGSAEIGWALKSRAARKRICLELGGNAALIIHRDADWQPRLAAIASAAFGYAGQSCISVQRLLIHADLYDEVRSALVAYVKEKVRSGDPREKGVLVGPMIDTAACDKIVAWIDTALAAGAKSLLPLERKKNVLFPVLLENVPPNLPIACEEAFAPVVVLEKYLDFDEAIARVNASRYGLQAGVFTRDLTLAWQAYRELEVGSVLINQTPTFRVENMPYGGVKDSGFGREGVRYAMEEMTELKSLIFQH